jgi:hypothetical protein
MATKSAAAKARKNLRAAERRAAANPHIHALPAEAVRERAEHARSGASGTHANKADKRCRTRSGQRSRAIREFA